MLSFMRTRLIRLMLAYFALLLCEGFAAAGVDWPQFRGAQASGVSERATPLTWNLATGENVRWQAPVPGLAHASPIIWENRLYLTTAVRPFGDRKDAGNRIEALIKIN